MKRLDGVYWHKGAGKWVAQPYIDGKIVCIGLYGDKKEAQAQAAAAIRRAKLFKESARMTPAERNISLLLGVYWQRGWMSGGTGYETEKEAWKAYVLGRDRNGKWSDVELVPGFNGRYALGTEGVLDVTTMHRAWTRDGMVRLVHASGRSYLVEIGKVMEMGVHDVDPLDLPGRDRVEWDAALGKWTIDGNPARSQKSAYNLHCDQIGQPKQVLRRRAMLLKPKNSPLMSVMAGNDGRQKGVRTKTRTRYSMTPGVSFNKNAKKWTAYWQKKHIGSYGTEDEAKEALENKKNEEND